MAATSRFAVAVHALTALAYRAGRGDAWVSSERLAESIGTNPVVVRRTVAALGRAGLVESQPGRGGGARLARAPEAIPLAAVYRALEDGDGVFAYNANAVNRTCAVSCQIRAALTPVFASVDDAVGDALGRVTLADMLARVQRPEPPRRPEAPAPA